MNEAQPLASLDGKGEGILHFGEVDQTFRLKIRGLIGLCMPPIFMALERRFGLRSMREEGTAPVMFYLQFETVPKPLVFGGPVETPYRVTLHRSVIPGPKGAELGKVERLLLDMAVQVQAEEGTGNPLEMGSRRVDTPLITAGSMRALHVLTRPVGPVGERRVLEVPRQLQGLQERPWQEPYPSFELLQSLPANYRQHETGPWQELRSVWGVQNTDINQHVNVQEYIRGFEDHFTRLLFGANLPVERHRIAKADVLFRKPFLLGQPFGVRGQLYGHGSRTLMIGSFHHVEAEGGLQSPPAVMARLEGEVRELG
jgi:hypothetical protein